ncbi:MAG: copper chaperone PCu(A)C [Rhizobiaceae bacterium]
MKRSVLFPLLAIAVAGAVYLYYPQAMTSMGGHSMGHDMSHDMAASAAPEKTGATVTKGDITVSGSWTKAMLPSQPAGGGYLIIENKGAAADRLLSATSTVTTNLQIHEMAMEGDVMKMRELPDGLEVPAGGKVELKPGGFHLMFMDMTKGFKEGETVAVILKFEKAGDVSVELPVAPAGK